MDSSKQPPESYLFGSFELLPQRAELKRYGKPVKIAPQPFRVLTVLVERAGEIVTREELHALNWGDDVVVDFEMGLNRCIRRVRAALLDDAQAPRYLETIPKTGYRFIAPVTVSISSPKQSSVPPEIALPEIATPVTTSRSETAHTAPETVATPSGNWWRFVSVGVGLAAILLVVGAFFWKRGSHGIINTEFTPTPLADELGIASTPSFSPGGQQVAFAWNGEKQNNFDIYVKMVGSPALVRVTQDSQIDFSPAWSPDGRFIAFCRGTPSNSSAIWITSPLGGPERRIVDLKTPAEVGYRVLTWIPDASALIFSDILESERTAALFVVDLTTDKKRQLTFPPPDDADVHPALAPDGHALAFSRDTGRGVSQIEILRLNRNWSPAGEPEKMLWTGFANVGNSRPKWTPDSKQLVFVSDRTGEHQLWKAKPDRKATPELIASLGTNVEDCAISRDGALAIVRSQRNVNIWKLNVGGLLKGESVFPIRILGSTRTETNPRVSPDSRKLAFESNRSGFMEIWTANTDGTDAAQVTSLRSPITGSPNWSHDGTRLAFDSRATGNPAIYVVPSGGGTPMSLMKNSGRDVMPDWSADDKWVYFTSDRSGTSQIWRVPSEGGVPQQISHQGGYDAVASPDGLFVYYAASRVTGSALKRLELNTGTETEVARGVLTRKYFATTKGVFYMTGDLYGTQSLMFNPVGSQKSELVTKFNHPVDEGIGLSADGSQLYYGQVDQGGGDLLYVEKFWH